MRALPPLKALMAFEATARHHGINRAAEELHVTPSAISHQIRALEIHLGVKLFHRAGRRLVLTDTGLNYQRLVGGVFDRIDAATQRIIDAGVSDVLTVHCPPTFAPAWLMPRIADFMVVHPDIDLRINATPEPADFLQGNVDVEIRYGRGRWQGFEAVPLMSEEIAPLCSPDFYRAHLSERPHASDLAGLMLIHSERSIVQWDQWCTANGVEHRDVRRGLRFDRGYLSIQAAVDGLGVALESNVFAARELESGTLIAPFQSGAVPISLTLHHLVYPVGFAEIPKVQAFRAWIEAHAAATRLPSLSGS